MSATGRADVRHADDFYATPAPTIRAILPHLDLTGRILEPAAGDGAIVLELLRAGVPPANIDAVEINPERAVRCQERTGVSCFPADFLAPDSFGANADLIVTNPPYLLAEQFIRQAMKNVSRDGEIVMLLRINFLASRKRVVFWREHPAHVFVLPGRPSFSTIVRDVLQCSHCKRKWKVAEGAGPLAIAVSDQCECGELPVFQKTVKTTHDACEYAWFCFATGRERRWDVLELPKETEAVGGEKNGIRRDHKRRVREHVQEAEG